MSSDKLATLDAAIDYLTDPVSASPGCGRVTSGVICLHVDDLFMTGDDEFVRDIYQKLTKEYAVGSEDKNNIEFCGQRIHCQKLQREERITLLRQMLLLREALARLSVRGQQHSHWLLRRHNSSQSNSYEIRWQLCPLRIPWSSPMASLLICLRRLRQGHQLRRPWQPRAQIPRLQSQRLSIHVQAA